MILTLILTLPLWVAVIYLWDGQVGIKEKLYELHRYTDNQIDHLETALRKVIAALELTANIKKNKEDEN